MITGRGQTLGSHLINRPGVDMISLTGAVATGKKVYDRLAADLSAAASCIRLGNADASSNEIRPLNLLRQRDPVASFVNHARELRHVEITTGGAMMADGFHHRRTVMAGARQEDEIVRRDVFGLCARRLQRRAAGDDQTSGRG